MNTTPSFEPLATSEPTLPIGSLFSAFDIRGTASSGLTRQAAWTIGMAIAEYFDRDGSVLLTENSSSGVAECLSEGIRLQGRGVVRAQNVKRDAVIGLITPDMSGVHVYSGGLTIDRDAATGETTIEIINGNGRLVDRETGLQRICELAEAGNFTPSNEKSPETQLV